MKKAIYIFLFLFIFIYIIWALSFFGVLKLDDIITITPYIKERMKTDEQYDKLMGDYYKLKNSYQKVEEENENLKTQLEEKNRQLKQKDKEIKDLDNRYKNLTKQKEEKKEKVDKLVNIYSEMDAEEAARLMADLNIETNLKILNELKDDHVAEIMMNLPQKRAVELTEGLEE